jgi:hypothetical protein
VKGALAATGVGGLGFRWGNVRGSSDTLDTLVFTHSQHYQQTDLVATSAIVSSTWLDLSSGQPVSFLFINELVYIYSCDEGGEGPRASRGRAASPLHYDVRLMSDLQHLKAAKRRSLR